MAVLGYIFALPTEEIYMKMHIGKDITGRSLKYLKNESGDDELGEPPYPDEAKMSEDEKEYCWNCLDHYFVCYC